MQPSRQLAQGLFNDTWKCEIKFKFNRSTSRDSHFKDIFMGSWSFGGSLSSHKSSICLDVLQTFSSRWQISFPAHSNNVTSACCYHSECSSSLRLLCHCSCCLSRRCCDFCDKCGDKYTHPHSCPSILKVCMGARGQP